MLLTLPPELEQQVNDLVLRGEYPTAEAVVVDAIKALAREHERARIEALLAQSDIDPSRLEQLLQEADDSGDYAEMTTQDWQDIEREGLAILNSRKTA